MTQLSGEAPDARIDGLTRAIAFCSLKGRCVAHRHIDRYLRIHDSIRQNTITLVNDPEPAVREKAGIAFRCSWCNADDKALTTLLAHLYDANRPVDSRARLIGVWADTEHDQPSEVALQLKPLLSDPAPGIVRAACAGLSKVVNRHKIIGFPRASAARTSLEAVLSQLDNADATVRLAALTTIREIAETHGDYPWFRMAAGDLQLLVGKGMEKASQDNDQAVRDLASSPLKVKAKTFADW